MDRSVEHDKASKDAKYELVKALANSKTIAEIFGNPNYLRLRTYLSEGPYYVKPISTTAVEGAEWFILEYRPFLTKTSPKAFDFTCILQKRGFPSPRIIMECLMLLYHCVCGVSTWKHSVEPGKQANLVFMAPGIFQIPLTALIFPRRWCFCSPRKFSWTYSMSYLKFCFRWNGTKLFLNSLYHFFFFLFLAFHLSDCTVKVLSINILWKTI